MRLEQLSDKKVGICVSGGLDSKTVTTRLKQAGVNVMCFTADLAQPDEKNINDIIDKMAPTGAKTIIVDLKDQMAEMCLTVLKAQATYDGGYWNTTGMGRAVTVNGLVNAMKENGCTVLSHGATGRGNDQVRFERYTKALAPDMDVYAAWRDPILLEEFPGRREMAAFLQKQGIEASVGKKKRYSTDGNLAGLSHEAEDLEDLETSCKIVKPIMGVWPEEAPKSEERVIVRIERGRPISINDSTMSPLKIMAEANKIAGRNGIWMKNALENRIIGTKSRGVYEAPGMEFLGYCVNAVYQSTMDRRSSQLFKQLSMLVSDQIYDGRFYDPATRAALAAVDSLAEPASAVIQVGLYKGNIYFHSLTECTGSLYCPADSSMESSDGLNPVSSQGYVEVISAEAIAMARAGQIKSKY